MKNFPVITLNQALFLLRITTAIVFLAHAGVRIANGTITQFADFLDSKGLVIGFPIVCAITVFEIVGGIALLLGYFTKWLALGFILMLAAGIAIIHAELGWFVGEHGTGGMEYSIFLIVALVVIAASDKKLP